MVRACNYLPSLDSGSEAFPRSRYKQILRNWISWVRSSSEFLFKAKSSRSTYKPDLMSKLDLTVWLVNRLDMVSPGPTDSAPTE